MSNRPVNPILMAVVAALSFSTAIGIMTGYNFVVGLLVGIGTLCSLASVGATIELAVKKE